jgi:hypothetical protein
MYEERKKDRNIPMSICIDRVQSKSLGYVASRCRDIYRDIGSL